MGRPKSDTVWKHFTNLQNKSVRCKFCEKTYKSGNVNRMAQHLTTCFRCPDAVKNEIKDSNRKTLRQIENVQEVSQYSQGSYEQFRNQSQPSTSHAQQDQQAGNSKNANVLIEKLAKAIFVSGAPLSMVEHPLWIEFFKELNPSFKMPCRKSLATTYLEKLYKEMKADVSKELEKEQYMHLQCDGWSNINNEGILNVIISNPEPYFAESIATEDKRHTSEYIKDELVKVMEAYGEDKMITVIGDNARNIQKAFELLKLKYPYLIPLNCAAHTLNLLCFDLLKNTAIKSGIEMAIDVIKTFKKSQIHISILNTAVKENNGESLKLPCKTRWGSHFNALKSLKNNKTILQSIAIDENLPIPLPHDIKDHLLEDRFWSLVDQCITILGPICDPIFTLESNKCNIQNVHMTFKDIKSKMEFLLPTTPIIDETSKQVILDAVERRKNDCVKPIHLAAYLLDPKSQGVELNQNEEMDAMEFIYNMAEHMQLHVIADLAQYKSRSGLWGKDFIWRGVQNLTPLDWWKGLCRTSPLSKIAVRILSAPCTSAATERSFSMHGNIHSTKRNRLTKERAAKITYIAYNWNLFHQNETEEYLNKKNEDDFDDIQSESDDTNVEFDFEFIDFDF